MKKSILSLSALTVLSSCAGPESYDQKMSRYTPKTLTKNQVPEIKTAGVTFSAKPTRGPASADVKQAEKTDLGFEANTTNKKLYFLTMLGQYESMKKYSAQFDAPEINICPHFHSSLLQHKEGKKVSMGTIRQFNHKKFTYEKEKLTNEAYVMSRPELSLPLSQTDVTPRVIDIMRSESELTEGKMTELVHRALDIHLSKTYTEIRELCEYGVSDNYYIYENLITHIKNNEFRAEDDNMNTLLKTTVFSNMALVTSLEKSSVSTGRTIASLSNKEKEPTPYVNEMMARLNVEWAKDYFNHIKTSR